MRPARSGPCGARGRSRGPAGEKELELGERRGDVAQHRPLGVAEHALPRLLRVVVVAPGEPDRVLEVVVVDVQEAQRRLLLGQQVESPRPARCGACRGAGTGSDAGPTPRASASASIDARISANQSLLLERGALGGGEQVADLVLDRLADAEEREELQVQPDPHEPPRDRRGAAPAPRCPGRARACRARPCRRRSGAPGTTGGRRGRGRPRRPRRPDARCRERPAGRAAARTAIRSAAGRRPAATPARPRRAPRRRAPAPPRAAAGRRDGRT